MHECVKKLTAPTDRMLYLWFEPWADGLGFPAGSEVELRGASPVDGELEIVVSEERTAVYGWPGSTLDVLVAGEMVRSFDIAVPHDPNSRLSTGDLMTDALRGAPVAKSERDDPAQEAVTTRSRVVLNARANQDFEAAAATELRRFYAQHLGTWCRSHVQETAGTLCYASLTSVQISSSSAYL
jgi:hypothetical protein